MRQRQKPFAPWKAEFRIAAIYWIIGAVWFAAALLWCIRDRSLAAEAAAEGAVLPVFFGLLRSDSARRRKYGSRVEKKWVAKLLAAAPADWAVELDLDVKPLGNIDVLAHFPNGRRCPIEIKSWRHTRYRLRFDRALHQVRRQRDALQAQNGVLWLPEARRQNAGYCCDIVIVQSDERFLIACLRKLKYRFMGSKGSVGWPDHALRSGGDSRRRRYPTSDTRPTLPYASPLGSPLSPEVS